MSIGFRPAVPEDAQACLVLRGRTRENAFTVSQLEALGITLDSWRAGIAHGTLPGHVALADGKIVGYCFGERDTGEIAVLALLPAHEGRGIGKELMARMVDTLASHGLRRLFLGCSPDPAVRSHGFYRHLGWTSTGTFDDAGDEVLEYFPSQPRGA